MISAKPLFSNIIFTLYLLPVNLTFQIIHAIDSSVDNHLVSVFISEDKVLEALNSLDPQKSTGIDGIGPKV